MCRTPSIRHFKDQCRVLCGFRDALSDLALHFLNKMKIMVVKDIERDEIEFICKVSIRCTSVCFLRGKSYRNKLK